MNSSRSRSASSCTRVSSAHPVHRLSPAVMPPAAAHSTAPPVALTARLRIEQRLTSRAVFVLLLMRPANRCSSSTTPPLASGYPIHRNWGPPSATGADTTRARATSPPAAFGHNTTRIWNGTGARTDGGYWTDSVATRTYDVTDNTSFANIVSVQLPHTSNPYPASASTHACKRQCWRYEDRTHQVPHVYENRHHHLQWHRVRAHDRGRCDLHALDLATGKPLQVLSLRKGPRHKRGVTAPPIPPPPPLSPFPAAQFAALLLGRRRHDRREHIRHRWIALQIGISFAP